jgi:ferric-dicitrate binding protein FerR (iron transport regulator)
MAQEAENIIVNDDLLSKYFSGEATPEEAMAIDDWKSGNAVNQQEFTTLWNAWNHIAPRFHKPGDTRSAWQELLPLPKRQASKHIILLRWAVAASLLICLSIPAALYFKSNNTPQQHTITASLDKSEQRILPCGSMVRISPGSSISYPLSLTDNERRVTLNGSSFFDVKTLANRPFTVTAGPVKIKVLGTSFHVLDTDTAIVVKVISGKVLVSTAQQQTIVSAGETGTYLKKEKRLVMVQVQRSFRFDNEDLEIVTATLSKAYDKKIIIRDAEISKLKISSNFENKPLEYILEVIATTLNLDYTTNQSNDEIYFEKAN